MRSEAIGSAKPGTFEVQGPKTEPGQATDKARQFKKLLKNKIGDVNDLQTEADGLLRDFVVGETDNVHEVMVAVNEADLSFRLMMEVRNKLVEAYQEVMRMQI